MIKRRRFRSRFWIHSSILADMSPRRSSPSATMPSKLSPRSVSPAARLCPLESSVSRLLVAAPSRLLRAGASSSELYEHAFSVDLVSGKVGGTRESGFEVLYAKGGCEGRFEREKHFRGALQRCSTPFALIEFRSCSRRLLRQITRSHRIALLTVISRVLEQRLKDIPGSLCLDLSSFPYSGHCLDSLSRSHTLVSAPLFSTVLRVREGCSHS